MKFIKVLVAFASAVSCFNFSENMNFCVSNIQETIRRVGTTLFGENYHHLHSLISIVKEQKKIAEEKLLQLKQRFYKTKVEEVKETIQEVHEEETNEVEEVNDDMTSEEILEAIKKFFAENGDMFNDMQLEKEDGKIEEKEEVKEEEKEEEIEPEQEKLEL